MPQRRSFRLAHVFAAGVERDERHFQEAPGAQALQHGHHLAIGNGAVGAQVDAFALVAELALQRRNEIIALDGRIADRDGEIAGRDYVQLVLGNIGPETESTTMRLSLTQLVQTARLYVDPATREAGNSATRISEKPTAM